MQDASSVAPTAPVSDASATAIASASAIARAGQGVSKVTGSQDNRNHCPLIPAQITPTAQDTRHHCFRCMTLHISYSTSEYLDRKRLYD